MKTRDILLNLKNPGLINFELMSFLREQNLEEHSGTRTFSAQETYKDDMNTNLKNLLLSELHCASGYLERLLYAIDQFSEIGHRADFQQLEAKFKHQLQAFVEQEILADKFRSLLCRPDANQSLSFYNERTTQLMESLISFNFHSSSITKTAVDYINWLYRASYELHILAHSISEIDIQLPRTNLIEMDSETNSQVENDEIIPSFYLKLEDVQKVAEAENITVETLLWQREKRYKTFLRQGHQAIFKKNNEEGLQNFKKALNYLETPEVLTLIAWSYSLIGDFNKAKKYCLKSIKLDPSYGPSLNDLGSYLLNEGKVEESLKWFDLAKNASNYQNREYPYINSGRAYVMLNNYAKALEEFSFALSLAPYHEELHGTVEKLKHSLKNPNEKLDLDDDVFESPSEHDEANQIDSKASNLKLYKNKDEELDNLVALDFQNKTRVSSQKDPDLTH
ncbi:MAG: tetratricopeptide repeat protein [Bacteriovoracaceae bacterium]